MRDKMCNRQLVLALLILAIIPGKAIASAEPPGLIIEEIVDSEASQTGLKVGDKLLTCDERPLLSPAAWQAVLQNIVIKRGVSLQALRGEQLITLTLRKGIFQITTRPDMPQAALALYEEGRKARQAKMIDKAGSSWAMAAKASEEREDKSAAAWLYSRAGEIEQDQRRWGSAQKLYAAAFKLLENGPDIAARSWLMGKLGRCFESLNDYSTAQRWYEQASRLDEAEGNEMWLAAELANMGNIAKILGDAKTAKDHYNRSLEINRRLAPDSLELANTLNGLGNVAYALRNITEAEDFYTQALKIREVKATNTADHANTLNNLGLVAQANGALNTAEKYFIQAKEIREHLPYNSLDLAGSHNSLGVLALNRGHLEEARIHFNESLTIYKEHKPKLQEVAGTLNNLGLVALARRDLDAAQQYFSDSLELRDKIKHDSLDVAHSFNNLGVVARLRGRLSEAEENYRRALGIFQLQAPNSLEVAGGLNNLGVVARLRGTGDLQKAESNYRDALTIREKLAPNSLIVASSLNNLGNIAYARGDLPAAQDYHSRAYTIRERLSPNSLDFAETLNDLGYLALSQQRLPEALDMFKRSVDVVEAQRYTILSPERRAILAANHTSKYTGLLQTYLALGDWPAAFATLERSRARSLVDILNERRLKFKGKATAELLKRQDDLDEKRSIIATQLLRPNIYKDEKKRKDLQEEMAKCNLQHRELEEEFRKAVPRYNPTPLKLKGAQQTLDHGTLLLAYYVEEKETYLFAVTRSDIKVFTLPVGKPALYTRINTFLNQIGVWRLNLASSLSEATEPGKQLYDTLIRPAQKLVDQAKRILICPDIPMHTLPFAALVSRTRPLRYFIEEKPLHTIASMSVYETIRKTEMANRLPQKKLLFFGDPIYLRMQLDAAEAKKLKCSSIGARVEKQPGTGRGVETADPSEEKDYLRPLPCTRVEGQALQRIFGTSAKIRMGQDAREMFAKQESGDYSILHFAVHGRLDKQNGMGSALILSRPDLLGVKESKEDNGLLEAWEVFEQIELRADLVVLSACGTGGGQNIRGEGVIGLTRAFQFAGAKSVVVSLWDVSDESTATLMKAFYQELQSGVSKDVALRRAMLMVRRSHSNAEWQHPYYWSSFILTGDWQ